MKKFSPEIQNECKILFVQKGMTAEDISDHFSGKPGKSAVLNWANKKDRHKKTWVDYRNEYNERRYEQMSPGGMARKIMDKIWDMLNQKGMDHGKFSDALSKMRKALAELTDPSLQIPVMYEMLTELILFAKQHKAEIVTEDFLELIRAYKNHIRARLENDFSPVPKSE